MAGLGSTGRSTSIWSLTAGGFGYSIGAQANDGKGLIRIWEK
jgi:hypothetical protein